LLLSSPFDQPSDNNSCRKSGSQGQGGPSGDYSVEHCAGLLKPEPSFVGKNLYVVADRTFVFSVRGL
jgi:hypothetical protein